MCYRDKKGQRKMKGTDSMTQEEIKYHNRLWYYKTYNKLIDKCLQMEKEGYPEDMYTEVHHILPKCQGGTNKKCNLVRMPVRYHIIAHLLLAKAFPEEQGLIFAAHVMLETKKNDSSNKLSTRIVSQYREDFAKSRVGSHHSEETKKKISESQKGKIVSREHIEYLRKINTGRKHSEDTRKKMSESRKRENLSEETRRRMSVASSKRKHTEEAKEKIKKANTGKIFSEEHRKNISLAKKGKPGHKHTREELEKMSQNKNRKKVIGPDGTIYESITKCAKYNSLCRDTISNWIHNHPEKGFKFYTEKDNN